MAVIDFKPVGLLERIKTAKSSKELTLLHTEGVGYEFATGKTRRRWVKAIIKRRKELSQVTKKTKLSKTQKG